MNVPVLELDGVTKSFGGVVAVNNVSLSVEEGSITGLIGPNGAGKTTVLNLVSGVHGPTEGEVRFGAEVVTRLPTHARARRGILRTFQQSVLYEDASVLDNINRFTMVNDGPSLWRDMLGTPDAKRFRAQCLERSFELAETVGLTPYVEWDAKSLPYGLQRTLGVAMALALGPKLIMLDEPVAGMNLSETHEMAELIRKINTDGTTVLLIEHDMAFVMGLCERVIVVAEGKKIAEGTPAQVQNNDDVVTAYLGVEDE